MYKIYIFRRGRISTTPIEIGQSEDKTKAEEIAKAVAEAISKSDNSDVRTVYCLDNVAKDEHDFDVKCGHKTGND